MKSVCMALAPLLALLSSCGDSEPAGQNGVRSVQEAADPTPSGDSAPAVSMSFEQFRRTLIQLRRAGAKEVVKCHACEGKGKVAKEETVFVVCPQCGGKGKTLQKCGYCEGTGKPFGSRNPADLCEDCGGKGMRLQNCPGCTGSYDRPGWVRKEVTKSVPCGYCKGTGNTLSQKGPTIKQVTDALGEPMKWQVIDGNYRWYFRCAQGTVKLSVGFDGPSDDPNTHVVFSPYAAELF